MAADSSTDLPDASPPASDAPDVSIVVVAFDDAERLPAAIASALGQIDTAVEVIVVDDCSTDATPDVVASHVRSDGRVRSIRLDANSGSGGAPRNLGIDAARGRWITFLDSDDVLPPEACVSMLRVGEELDAEVVSGRTVRREMATGKETAWRRHLFDQHRLITSVGLEQPQRIYDSLSVAKLYRRDVLVRTGLRFPEGILYEDQVFTAMMYHLVRRLAVVPDRVYTWCRYPPEFGLSVTDRRHEISNLVDRLTANRLIDEYFREQGAEALLAANHEKFVSHDLSLYLKDLVHAPDEWAATVRDLVVPHLTTLPLDSLDGVPPVKRAAAFLLMQGDIDGVRSAMRFQATGDVGVELERIGDTVLWSGRHRDTPESARWLDVTELGLHRRAAHMIPLGHEVTRTSTAGSTLEIDGLTHNPLGTIDRPPTVTVTFASHGGDDSSEHRAEVTQWSPDGPVRWTLVVDRTALPGPGEPGTFDVLVTISVPGRMPSRRRLPGPSVRTHDGAPEVEQVGFETTPDGFLALRLHAGPDTGRSTDRSSAARSPGDAGNSASERVRAALRRSLRVGLPRRDSIVFESNAGQGCSGGPKRVHEVLRTMAPDLDVVWSYADFLGTFPDDARLVRRGGRDHLEALARASYWCDDQGLALDIPKPRRTRYLQTWHEIPVPGHRAGARVSPERLASLAERWDLLCCPTDHVRRDWVDRLGFRATLVGPGTPRNDRLHQHSGRPADAAVKRISGWDGVRTTVLHIPPHRPGRRHATRPLPLGFSADVVGERLRDSHEILVQSPVAQRSTIPARHLDWMAHVEPGVDPVDVLLAADVLIAEVSPLVLDYAVLRRPIIILGSSDTDASDVVRAIASLGRVVTTDEELVEAITTVGTWFAERRPLYDRVVTEYCGQTDDGAAERAVRSLLT